MHMCVIEPGVTDRKHSIQLSGDGGERRKRAHNGVRTRLLFSNLATIAAHASARAIYELIFYIYGRFL